MYKKFEFQEMSVRVRFGFLDQSSQILNSFFLDSRVDGRRDTFRKLLPFAPFPTAILAEISTVLTLVFYVAVKYFTI